MEKEMKKVYKMVDGIPIWQHLKNGVKDNNIKLIATDYGAFAEIVGKRVLNKLIGRGGILGELFPEVEIISVQGSPKTRILKDAKIELGDLILEISYKDSSGKFGKKMVIFEIKHGRFQIEQNQLRRYCFMINNPDAFFPKADELKVIFMMLDKINTTKGSASYSMSELCKELATEILGSSPLPSQLSETYYLGQDPDEIDTNVSDGIKAIVENTETCNCQKL